MLRYFGSKKREFLGENATSWTRRVAFVGALSVPGSRKPPCFQGNLPSENSATSKLARRVSRIPISGAHSATEDLSNGLRLINDGRERPVPEMSDDKKCCRGRDVGRRPVVRQLVLRRGGSSL